MPRQFGSVEERAGLWYVRFSWKGERVRRAVANKVAARKTLDTVEHLLRERGKTVEDVLESVWGETFDEVETVGTFREVAEAWLVAIESNGDHKESTLASHRRRWSGLKAKDPAWLDEDVCVLDRKTIAEWLRTLKKGDGTKVSGATRNRYKSFLTCVLDHAVEEWGLAANPAKGIKGGKEGKRIRHLSDPERKRLLKAAKGTELDPLVRFSLWSGCRAGEMRSLRWRDVDMDEETLTVTPENSKTHTARTLPMPAFIVTLLESLPRARACTNGSDFVFSREDGRGWTEDALRWAWDDLRERAALVDFKWHDLRHSAATAMVRAGVGIFEVSKWLGHKRIETTMRYAHFAPDVFDRVTSTMKGSWKALAA